MGAPIAVILAAGEGDDAVDAALAEAGVAPRPSRAAGGPEPRPRPRRPRPRPPAAQTSPAADVVVASPPEDTSRTRPALREPDRAPARQGAGHRPERRHGYRSRTAGSCAATSTIRRPRSRAGRRPAPRRLPPASGYATSSSPPCAGHRAPAHREQDDGPALLRHGALPRRPAARAARAGQRGSRPQGLGQRLRAEGRRRRAARRARRNAIWGGDHITPFGQADIAVAVAVDGGLLTPVLRGVDTHDAVAGRRRGRRRRRARPCRQAAAGRARGRQLLGVEPRHVRGRRVLGDPEPAAVGHPRGVGGEAAAGRRGRCSSPSARS